MNGRKKFKWIAFIQPNDGGEMIEVEVENYWSPKHEGTDDAIARTAAAEAYLATGKQRTFTGVSAQLVV